MKLGWEGRSGTAMRWVSPTRHSRAGEVTGVVPPLSATRGWEQTAPGRFMSSGSFRLNTGPRPREPWADSGPRSFSAQGKSVHEL